MNNKVKMAIKSVPVVSGIAKGLNRTVGITIRHAVRYPSMRELNVKLVNSLQKLNDANDMRIWYFESQFIRIWETRLKNSLSKNGLKTIIRWRRLLKYRVKRLTLVLVELSV